MNATLAVLSDLHLSPTHGFFWDNWLRARDAVAAGAPEATIVNGDLCINGPDDSAELAFAARVLRRLPGIVHALPGNHDVGDEPPGQDAHQIVNAARLSAWTRHVGPDRVAFDLGAWRVLGMNAQLCGSGLPAEEEQWTWLASALDHAERPVALFLHKPLFLEDPGENSPTIASLNPEPRARLLSLLRGGPVRMIVSGHLHARRDRVVNGIRHLWVPATSFLGAGGHGGEPSVGAVLLDLSGPEAVATDLPIPGLVAHDLTAIKGHGHYAFLRDMPPCPPRTEDLPRVAADMGSFA
ncbi:metallophosphoesterase family protein [Roseomonas sp. CCTCC AB2023176]|uniref:metallophosphoesterase family protein n=1 Tax=Roseomonas sp. CCTCC AB2023176 TaxID=3342640 RepID=UPI0035D62864